LERHLPQCDVGVSTISLGSSGKDLTDSDTGIDRHVAGYEHFGVGLGRQCLDVLTSAGLCEMSVSGAASRGPGWTYIFNGLAKWEESHVLRIVPEVQVSCDGSKLWQLRLDARVDVCFVVHVRCFHLAPEPAFSAWTCRPDVVLNLTCGSSSSGKVHPVSLFNLTALMLALTLEERFPPVGDRKNGMCPVKGRP
jgi:hypothetical protein